MSLSQKRCLFSKMFAQLIVWAHANDFDVAIDEVKRTLYQQREYVREGASKTLKSKHLEGLAGDLVMYGKNRTYLTKTEHYRPLGHYWKSLHPSNVWGGDWNWDGGHFELDL